MASLRLRWHVKDVSVVRFVFFNERSMSAHSFIVEGKLSMLGCPTNAPRPFVQEPETRQAEVTPGHTIEGAIKEQETMVAQCLRNILLLQDLQRSATESWSHASDTLQNNAAKESTYTGLDTLLATTSLANQMQESINRLLLRLIANVMDQFLKQSAFTDSASDSDSDARSFAAMPPVASNDDVLAQPSGPAASGQGGNETAQLAQVVSVFGRHQDFIKDHGKIRQDDLVAMANDASTPEDVRQACQQVLDNPHLWDRLDSGKTGKLDGHFSIKDVHKLQGNAEIQAYTQQQSEEYAQNYIPSESTDGQAVGRPITDSDAERELYRFSESLPKHINLGMLAAIADGRAHMDKCPPQLRAAAQHFASHPDAWRNFTHGADKISRNKLCDLAAQQVHLRSDEATTLKTIEDNQAIFFGRGKLTKGALEEIASDQAHSEAVRTAARALNEDSTLFSMLDNAKTHAGGNGWHKSNDGKITQKDFHRFMDDAAPFAAAAQTPSQSSRFASNGRSESDVQAAFEAQEDMIIGREEEPDAKKSRGGDVKKGLIIAGEVVAAATMFIPGPGEIIGLAGGAARLGGLAAKEAATAAAKRASTSLAENIAKDVAKEGAKEGAKEAAQQGLNQVIADQAQKKAQKNAEKAAANAAYTTAVGEFNPTV